jgi:hypothetical protein
MQRAGHRGRWDPPPGGGPREMQKAGGWQTTALRCRTSPAQEKGRRSAPGDMLALPCGRLRASRGARGPEMAGSRHFCPVE